MIEFIHTEQWGKVVSRLLKSEMAIKGMKYKDLKHALEKIGTHQSEGNLRQKINRGQLSAQLLLQLLIVMDVESIETSQLKKIIVYLENEAS